MALYHINFHPNHSWCSILVGKGGFISKEYTETHPWITYMQRREFHFSKDYLYDLVDFLYAQDPDDCVIKIRNERSDEWVNLGPDDYIKQNIEIIPRYHPPKKE